MKRVALILFLFLISIQTFSQTLTKLRYQDCGATDVALDQTLKANPVTGATQYDFKVRNAELGFIEIISKPNRAFKLKQLEGTIEYSATYKVKVRTIVNGITNPWGQACFITTCQHPLTKLRDEDCGAVDVAFNQPLKADPVPGATQYEFWVRNQVTGFNEIIARPYRTFRLKQLQGQVEYNTFYIIRVRTTVGSSTSSWGSFCYIVTCEHPLTKLRDEDCGAVNVAFDQLLKADPVIGASLYEFEVKNETLGFYEILAKPNKGFKLKQLQGDIQYSTSYQVRVRTTAGSGISDWGQVCFITTESAPLQADAGEDKIINWGETVIIGGSPTATGGTPPYTYQWNPPQGLGTHYNRENPQAQPVYTTTYFITVTDADNTTATDDVTVTVNDQVYTPETAHSYSEYVFDTITGIDSLPPVYVSDKWGNEILLNDLRIGQHSEFAGIFELHFIDDDDDTGVGFDDNAPSGDQRRQVFIQVCKDISELLGGVLYDPWGNIQFVQLKVISDHFFPDDPYVLGAATPYYLEPGAKGVTYNSMWKYINTGIDPYFNIDDPNFLPDEPIELYPNRFYHGAVDIHFNYATYNLNLYSQQSNVYDLYSVILHEMLHNLGIATRITGTGAYLSPGYTIWDYFLHANGTPVISYDLDNINNCDIPVFNSTTGEIFQNCGNANIQFIGPGNNPVSTIWTSTLPQDFNRLAHFNCDPVNGYIMNRSASIGYHQRFPHIDEVQALCVMGYNIQDIYGNGDATLSFGPDLSQINYNNYFVESPCPLPRIIAGANDFFINGTDGEEFNIDENEYLEFVNTGTQYNIIANDNNGELISCPEIITTGGYLTNTDNPQAFKLYRDNYSLQGAYTIIRYRPVNSAGQRGNATYIFVYNNPKELTDCLYPENCEYVCNGDFELGEQDCTVSNNTVNNTFTSWQSWGSVASDLYNLDNMCADVCINTSPTSTPNESSRFIGMFHGNSGTGGEKIYTKLTYPLNQGMYTFSMWVYFNDCSTIQQPPGTNGRIRIGLSIDEPVWNGFLNDLGVDLVIYETGLVQGPLPRDQWILIEFDFTCNYDNINYLSLESIDRELTDNVSRYYIDDVSITDDELPEGIITTTPSTCNNDGTATVTVTGGTPTYVYLWDDPDFQSTQTATGLAPGTYHVTVTDAIGCSFTEEAIVEDEPLITISINSANADCNEIDCNGWADVDPSGGTPPYYFLWSNGQNTPTATDLCEGEYTVTVSDAEGCIASQSVIIEHNQIVGDIIIPDVPAGFYASNFNTIGLPLPVITGEYLGIDGDLIIDTDVTFKNCKLNINTDVKITIESGAILTITGGTRLREGCGQMWDGIYLEDPAAKLVIDGNPAFWQRPVIMDAINAVVSKNQSIFEIDYAIFSKNTTGMIITNTDINSYVNNTIFYGDAPINGLPASTGIRVNYTGNSVTTGVWEIGPGNIFYDIPYGIWSYKSDIFINNSRFRKHKNAISAFEGKYLQIDNCSIVDSKFGIWVYRYMKDKVIVNNSYLNDIYNDAISCVDFGPGKIEISDNELNMIGNTAITVNYVMPETGYFKIIRNNTINDALQGIICTNFNEPEIIENTISLTPTYVDPGYRYNGILTQGCMAPYIYDNYVIGNNSWAWWTLGVATDNSPDGTVMCNRVRDIGKGLWFGGDSPDTKVEGNVMKNCTDGLQLNYNWGFIGPQGNPFENDPSDNRWFGTFNNSQTWAYWSFGDQSPFYVRNAGQWGNEFVPTENIDAPGFPWSITIPFTQLYGTLADFECGSKAVNIDKSGEDFEVERKIAANEIEYKVFPEENHWAAKNYLYHQIKKYPEVLDIDIVFQYAYDSLSNTTIADLYQFNELMCDTVDSVTVDQLQQFNNSIETTNTIEYNHKKMNEIYLETFALDIDSLTTGQYNEIYDIATQCPYTGGNGVYRARVMLSIVDSTFAYIDECEMPLPPEGKGSFTAGIDNNENTDLPKIMVYPNPAKDELIIESDNDLKNARFELYSVIGNRIKNIQLPGNKNIFNISLIDIESGIYMYKIFDNDNLNKADKLIIIK